METERLRLTVLFWVSVSQRERCLRLVQREDAETAEPPFWVRGRLWWTRFCTSGNFPCTFYSPTHSGHEHHTHQVIKGLIENIVFSLSSWYNQLETLMLDFGLERILYYASLLSKRNSFRGNQQRERPHADIFTNRCWGLLLGGWLADSAQDKEASCFHLFMRNLH